MTVDRRADALPRELGRGPLRRHRRRRHVRHRPDPAGPRRHASPAATPRTPASSPRCARSAPGVARRPRRRRTSATPTTVVVSTAIRADNPELVEAGAARAAGAAPRRGAGRADGRPPQRRRRRHPRQDHDDLDADRRAAGTAASTRPSPSAATSTSRAPTPTTARATSSSPRPTRATARSSLLPARRDRHQRRARPPGPLRRPSRPSRPLRRVRRQRRRRGGFVVVVRRRPGRAPARGGRRGPRRRRAHVRRGRRRRPPHRRPASRRTGAAASTPSLAARRLGRVAAAGARRAQRAQRRRRAAGRPRARAARRAAARGPRPLRRAPGAGSSSRARPAGVRVSTTTPTTRPRSPPTLRAARGRSPARPAGRRVPAAPLQPDRACSPTAFGAALGLADEVVVMEVYAAREDPIPARPGALVARRVPLPPEPGALRAVLVGGRPGLAGRARPGDLVHDARRRRRHDGRARGAGAARGAADDGRGPRRAPEPSTVERRPRRGPARRRITPAVRARRRLRPAASCWSSSWRCSPSPPGSSAGPPLLAVQDGAGRTAPDGLAGPGAGRPPGSPRHAAARVDIAAVAARVAALPRSSPSRSGTGGRTPCWSPSDRARAGRGCPPRRAASARRRRRRRFAPSVPRPTGCPS